MKRGEVWTVSGGPDYTGKPRPAVIVQEDAYETPDSLTLCPMTTDTASASYFRVAVKPNAENGLRSPSRLMADKITTVPKTKLGARVGRLADEDIVRLNRAVTVFLGLASPARSR